MKGAIKKWHREKTLFSLLEATGLTDMERNHSYALLIVITKYRLVLEENYISYYNSFINLAPKHYSFMLQLYHNAVH